MATNEATPVSTERPDQAAASGKAAVQPRRETPQAFYKRVATRPDIREILKRLAR